jgi:hypothetical protein
MKAIATIPHPSLRISLFLMNDKYIIKIEAGQMEQTFKIPKSEIRGVEEIHSLLDEDFMKKVMGRFNEMFLEFNSARGRLALKTQV